MMVGGGCRLDANSVKIKGLAVTLSELKNSQSPVIDQNALAELDAADPDDPLGLLSELVGLYSEDGRKHLNTLSEARERGDAEGLIRTAHALKGSSRMVGAARVSDLCQIIESAGRTSEQELQRLEKLFEEALAALKRELVLRGGPLS